MAAALGVKKKILVNIDFGLGNKLMVGTGQGEPGVFRKRPDRVGVAEAEYPARLKQLLTRPGQRRNNYH